MANSIDPDQTPRSAASDLGLHCLQKPICPNTKGYYANVPVHKWSSYQYEKLAKTNILRHDDPNKMCS